jgi:pSer/pThr/pTyr-binding forkhead associated (FHA) protein
MNALTLQWDDAGQLKTEKIYEQQPTKNAGTVRIGRDPVRCDIVLSHPTVSGLHVEIYFEPQQNNFLIRNLRPTNPPLVDNKQLLQGEVALKEGSIICLGEMELKVIAVTTFPDTVIATPKPPTPPKPQLEVKPSIPTHPPQQPVYGIQCSNCNKISPYEYHNRNCPWCGHFLGGDPSILITPGS